MLGDSSGLLQTAIQYLQMGFSIVIVAGDKAPLHSWRKFQNLPMTTFQLKSFNLESQGCGLAIIGGNASRNFVTYDIDCKNDRTGTLINHLFSEIKRISPILLSKLVIASTPSGGFHFYFLTNQEITSRVVARDIRSGNEWPVLIELRSKFQYSVVPPSPGYSFVQGDFSKLKILSSDELDVLLTAGACFNRSVNKQSSLPTTRRRNTDIIGSPLDDYDKRGDVIGLLLYHGWKLCSQYADSVRFFLQRPGITNHKTSANFHKVHRTFIVHSTSTRFLPGVAYTPSAVFAELECMGNYTAATQKLLTLGFGIPYHIQKKLGLSS